MLVEVKSSPCDRSKRGSRPGITLPVMQQTGRATGHLGGGPGADHLRQPGHRLHRRPGRHQPIQRPADGRRSPAGGPARREPAPPGPLGQPPPVRPPVPSRHLYHGAAGDHPGDPPLPRFRADQRDRPQDGRADRGPLRPGHPGGDRAGTRPAGRGARPWPQAHRDDHRRLGRAAGHQGGHGLPARRWRVHVTGGADLQDLPRRRDRGGAAGAVPAGQRRVGDWVQDRRPDRPAPGHPS